MALWAGLQEIVNLLQGKIPHIVSWIARFNKWAWHWTFGCLRGVESNEYFSDDALSHVAQTDGHLNLTDVGRLVDTYYYRVVLT